MSERSVAMTTQSDRNDNKTKAWVSPNLPPAALEKPFSPEAHGYQKLDETPDPPPLEKPPFTLKDIRDCVPSHCFERSLLKSLLYTLHNFAVCTLLFYCATWIEHLSITS